jgi:hypothetical protein
MSNQVNKTFGINICRLERILIADLKALLG